MSTRPSKAALPFCTADPTFCAVCQHPAAAVGYAPLGRWLDQRGPVMWLCTNPQCHRKARDLYHEDDPESEAAS
jgi:hypothetical protein